MTRFTRFFAFIAMLLMCGMAMQAASYTYTVPKHEFRSAWVATVW